MAKRKSTHNPNDSDGFIVSDSSRQNSTAPPSKRTKKATATTSSTTSHHFTNPTPSTPTANRDPENNLYWEISKARRVVLNDFKGKKMISIREYYEKDGTWLPGKKGINMTLEQYGALMGVIPAVDRELRRGGVENLPRVKYGDGVEDGGEVKDEPDDEDETEETEASGDGGGRANHEATSDEEE